MIQDIETIVDAVGEAMGFDMGMTHENAMQRATEAVRRALAETAPRCIYPECCNTRRTRGLCHQHYQTMRSYVRDGKATEADLEARGLLLGKGTGGSPVAGHDAFLLGSDVRGDEQ